jgi:NLR family CARD domain-containing protein 3
LKHQNSQAHQFIAFLSFNLRPCAITKVRVSYSLVHSRSVPFIDLARRIGFSFVDNLNLAKNSSESHKILQTRSQIRIMESLSNFMVNEDTTAPELSTPSSPGTDSDGADGLNNSFPFLDDLQPSTRTMDEHISILQSLEQGDFSNQEGIQALPGRRNKSQRPLAIQLAKILYPEISEIAALIKYESLTSQAKSVVRDKQKARLASKNQARTLKVQGPWAGQALDPVDLKGPDAIPMPVEIGTAEDFAPILGFLAHESFEEASRNGSKSNFQFLKKTEQFTGNVPLLEFPRGIIYEDGRLDLCKKVVGPTHIGKLMESLESNHQICHFLLGNNAISTTGAKRIAEFIHKYPDRMKTWYLAGCHITRHGLSLLVPQMITSSTITNLWFKRNPFGPNSITLLADLVLQTPNLRTLDLETTELGDEGTRQFIDSITGHQSSLRNLYLNANGIGEGGCASLGKYLADPNCVLESLFLSTNPIGDAGMLLLVPGLAKNKTLKRFMCASSGLTGKGLSYLAGTDHQLQTIDIGASQTTKAHAQKFNYFDDTSVGALKSLIMTPSLRWLNVGGTIMTDSGVEEIKSAVARSELVFFHMHCHRVHDGVLAPKSCSLELRKQLAKNQAKYFPQYNDYDEFLKSDDFRFLRNTSDVRKIDSMYRTQDKRLGLPMDAAWEDGDPTWKLIIEDAKMTELEVIER